MVIIIALILIYIISIFKELNYKDLDVGDLGISSNTVSEAIEKGPITNISLFGVDQRNEDEKAHSDAIIVLSVDKKHKKIKLSSIMRDSLVTIDKFGQNKITQENRVVTIINHPFLFNELINFILNLLPYIKIFEINNERKTEHLLIIQRNFEHFTDSFILIQF